MNKKKKNGLEHLSPFIEGGTSIAYFSHVYQTAGYGKDAEKKHMCLRSGFWCWRNALEHPFMAFLYIKERLKRR